MRKTLSILLLFVSTSALYSTNYSIYEVDLGGAESSFPISINNTVQILGTLNKEGVPHHFLWTRDTGLAIMEGFPVSANYIRIETMNNNGQVVGTCLVNDGWLLPYWVLHGFLWSLETGYVDLGAINGKPTSAEGINDNGKIVLRSEGSCYIWDNGKITPLPDVVGLRTLWADLSFYPQVVINNNDQLAYYQNLSSWYIPFKGAKLYNLTTQESRSLTNGIEGDPHVAAINDSGTVLGTLVHKYVFTSTYDGFLAFPNGDFKVFPNVMPLGLNASNTAVGFRKNENSEMRAVIIEEGIVSDLTELCIPSESNENPKNTIIVATDVNDMGEILAIQRDKDNQEKTVILVPQ